MVTILVLIYTQKQEVWFLCNSYISAIWSQLSASCVPTASQGCDYLMIKLIFLTAHDYHCKNYFNINWSGEFLSCQKAGLVTQNIEQPFQQSCGKSHKITLAVKI